MSSVTRLARQAGQILSSVHMGNLSPATEMKNAQKAPKYLWNSVMTCQRPYKPVENVSSRAVSVSGLEHSYGKNFQHGYQDIGCKNRDLGNRSSPPSHMNTSKFCEEKSGEVRSQKWNQPG